jgi:DNA-binding response OmpR family regulator
MTGTKTYQLLLVDDNPVNLELLQELIAIHLPECRTHLASNGQRALELTREHDFDGAFVDMQMPGMDGIEVCRRLKESDHTAGIPVILITAHQSTAELRAEGLNAGAYDFISQPIRNVELVARIKVLLRIKSVEEQLQRSNQGLRKQVSQKTAALRWMTGLLSASGADSQVVSAAELEPLAKLLEVDGELSFSAAGGELFDRFPATVKRSLISLSLLQDIPVQLAERLTGSETIRGVLDYLERHNVFVNYSPECDCYRLSGPLRNYLESQVRVELNGEEIDLLYLTAAHWWLDHREPVFGIDLLLQAGEFQAAERVLQQLAPTLFSSAGLTRLLLREELIVRQDPGECPWLHASLAVALLEQRPRQGLQLLAAVGELFADRNDLSGVLFSCCHQLRAHFTTDGDLARQAALLQRAERVRTQLASACDPHLGIQAALFLALGQLQVGEGVQLADRYLDSFLTARESDVCVEYQAWYGLIRSYGLFLSGKWRSCFRELEQTWKLECQPESSVSVVLAGTLIRSMLLEVYGEDSGRAEVFARLARVVPEATRQQTLLPILQHQQDLQAEIARGYCRQAQDVLADLTAQAHQLSDHIQSQVLELRAQVMTLAGKVDDALDAARESIRLRELAGGEYFRSKNRLLMAGVLHVLGASDESRRQLETLLATTPGTSDRLLDRLAGWLALQIDPSATAPARGQMLGQLLGDLDHLGLAGIPFWFPPLHRQLWQDGVAAPRDRIRLNRLAKHHLQTGLAENGTMVPLLKIRALGDFSLSVTGGATLQKRDISSSFRQLLAMLLAAPDQQLSQEEIQGHLWPESSAVRSRSKFDSLLLRLRKTLEEILAGQEAKRYLYLQKGVLCLNHCRIDAVDFEQLTRKGLRHARRMEIWQADTAFRKAFELWRGEFNPGVPLDEKSDFYRQDLLLLYLDAAQHWAELLRTTGQHDQAIEITRQALQCDPTNDLLLRLNRSSCLALGMHSQAHQVLKEFAAALRRDGHPEEDIRDILASVTAGDRLPRN